MNQPLVSVVITTFNMGQYLPAAVTSVLSQTWKNLELIIIDDGSTDNTSETMQPFLQDPRVHYIKQENKGQPRAKNAGLKACKGEYISFCDGDDLWEPDKLEIQIPFLEADSALGVVYSTVTLINEHDEVIDDVEHVGKSGKITNDLVIYNFIPFGTAVVRSKCIEQCGGFDDALPMGIDWDLWLRVSLNWNFLFIPKATYKYRVWPGQMSKNHRGRYNNAFAILEKFFRNNPNAVSAAVRRRAWSDTYAGKALAISRVEKTTLEPLQNAIRAVFIDPFYPRAWRAVVKVLIKHT